METHKLKYQIIFFDPNTFETSVRETELPKVVVKEVEKSLKTVSNKHNNLQIYPTMVSPSLESVSIGIIDVNTGEMYKIVIEKVIR